MARSKNQRDVGVRNEVYRELEALARTRQLSIAVLVHLILRQYLDTLPVIEGIKS